MQTNRKKNTKDNQILIDSYDYLANAATSQDCTGLIPGNPFPGDVMDSYKDIYHYEPPVVPQKEKS